MANNNVQNVRFLRNGNLFDSRSAATNALTGYTLTADMDGSVILARYSGTTTGETPVAFIKTLVGFVYYKDASNKSVTIFDIDDAGADVDEKIKEIMDILGDGVGSGETETVSAQLAALSGNNESTSADTSVEGAKRYADQILSDTISALDYSGVTTGDGVYVTNVTEADGKVAATTATLPSVEAISEAGKAITAVSESLGTISATAGNIDAQYVDVSYSAITANNVKGALAEIADEIDGMDLEAVSGDGEVITMVSEADGKVSASKTAIKDVKLTGYEKTSATGAIEATDDIEDALSKLENKTAAITINDADQSINVTPTTSGTDISVNIKSGEKVLAKDGNEGIYTDIDLVKITTGLPETIKERYQLLATDDSQIGINIDIPKDSHIVSINYITTGEHAQNLEYVYIDVSGNTQTTYVDMSELVLETEFASGVTVTGHIAHGVVDQTSEKDSQDTPVDFLTVGTNGFKVSGIKDEIKRQIDALDATVTGATSGSHITISVEELDGKLVQSGFTIEENDIANASDLAELSGKTVTEIASSNSSITVATAATTAADGTVKYDVITDASKIKMSGFTSTDVLSGITSSSSITEAFEEVDKVITDNEQVVSAALNDLEDKISAETENRESADTQINNALSAETAARKVVDGQNGDTYAANTTKTYISGATSLNDADIKLNDALAALDADVIKQVKVNNVPLTGTSNSVNVQITSAAGTGATSTPITVDTDANGAVTLKLEGLDCGTY